MGNVKMGGDWAHWSLKGAMFLARVKPYLVRDWLKQTKVGG